MQLLSQLALKTYSKTQPDRDIETVSITKKIVTIQGWLGDISTRQLRTLFVQIEEIKVIKRAPGKITVMLNLDTLKNAEPCADIAKRSAKQHKTDRAAKARVQRAANRKVTRLADAAKAMRDGKERFFDAVLRSETHRKHASLPFKAESSVAEKPTKLVKSANPVEPSDLYDAGR